MLETSEYKVINNMYILLMFVNISRFIQVVIIGAYNFIGYELNNAHQPSENDYFKVWTII